jgi:hypothetical protein
MPKQLMIDPPSGWQYGFPKPVPSGYIKNETLMRIWLAGEGYPAKDVDLALKHSRYWETEIDICE